MILGLQLLLAILNRGRLMHEQRWSATAAAEAIVRALHQRLRPTRALQAGGGRRNMLWSAYLPVATALTN